MRLTQYEDQNTIVKLPSLEYVCMNDPKTIEGLVKNRWKLDSSFGETKVSLDDSGGDYGVNEDVCCVYIDLDRLIEQCKLSAPKKRIIALTMQGYSMQDIAIIFNRAYSTIVSHFNTAIAKIAAQNMTNWEKVYKN